ncbi:MAG: carbamoyltransferase C-terminal domain-containing protein, partial [Myxococcota bacterium]|nr:carbamoyltransferase C-terminal domain-containing protein [Myxococcota bacterium]
ASYIDPLETFRTNVIGTSNVLQSARFCESVKVILNVTTDKCYENKEDGKAFMESDTLGGHDPYSSSKACSELVTDSFRKSYFNNIGVGVATARAGNVIGGGDWSLNRLVPDCVRAWALNKKVKIRNPNSTRPWQHVLEPLSGYITLSYQLKKNKNIKNICYDHSAPHALPLHMYYRFSYLDKLIVNGNNQKNYLSKYLNWPLKKIKVKNFDNFNELCSKTAELLDAQSIISWFQGKMEFGPRALGNRSIIMDPRNKDAKQILNLKIKLRENFRPFAPSI